MTLLHATAALLIPAGAAGVLAWLGRGRDERWAVLSALALGGPESAPGVDLRFASVCAALSCELSLLALGVLPGLAPARLVAGVLIGTPLLAVLLAGGADLLRRGQGEASDAAELELLLDQAEHEVREARVRVQDEQRIAVLDTLAEANADYREALRGGGSKALRERVEGVIALTRSCLAEEGLAAAQALGLSPQASPAEAREVFQALTRIYQGPQRLAGVDPKKHSELRDAYERFKARAAVQDAEPLGSAQWRRAA